MENTEPIAIWALRNHKALNLNITRLNWIDSWIPSWSDLDVSLTLDGQQWSGRGTANSFHLALTKGMTEALERHAGYSADLSSSNGIAGHEMLEKSQANAMAELLERDAFLSHFYSGLPFKKIMDPSKLLGESFSKVLSEISNKGIEFHLFEARQYAQAFVFGCYFIGKNAITPFGAIIGLGASNHPENAAQQAFIEGIRNVSWVLNKKPAPLSFEDFKSIPYHGPEHHRLLALNTSYIDCLPDLRENAFELPVINPQIVFHSLKSQGPVHITRATSPDVQNLFFGITPSDFLNINHLKHFGQMDLCSARLKLPHPLG